MRYVCPAAALVALTIFSPSALFGQGQPAGLSIGNYQFVDEQRSTRTQFFVTYRADLVNSGPARPAITATVTSLVPNMHTVPGLDTLHFGPIAANGHVTSSDTFTLLIDQTVPADFTKLQWSFLNPIADAGASETVKVGSTVNLSGSASTDPSGGGALTYAWSFASVPAGSNAVLQNPTAVTPSFIVDTPGNYVVTLTVSNGVGKDSANVKISTINSPPVANAGANQTVNVGATVTLNGSGSFDVDGNPITYFWTLVSAPAGSTAGLTNLTTVAPSFVVDKQGSYVIQLVVNDGTSDSAPSTVTISTGNTAPVANAGPGQSVKLGALVQLNGSGSTDVDGNPLTYQWTLIQAPANSAAALSSPGSVNPTFTADLPGTYIAQLIVNDGKADSTPSTVAIATNAILPPVANAGPNQTVVHGTTVTLSGSAVDPQGFPVTFQWALITRPLPSLAILSSSSSASPTFIADIPGIYVVQLIVTNGYASSAPKTVTITTTNTAPVAAPGPDRSVAVGSTVNLDGSGSHDADNDPITFSWSFLSRPAGSSATLSSSTSVTPSFVADLAGAYVLQLIVNDGFTNSAPVTATITAAVMKITLTPDPLNLMLNTPGNLTVNLSTPTGPAGIVVKFTFDPTGISAPASVAVPANSTSATIIITPLAVGATTILASGGGYQPGSATINVGTPNIAVTLAASGVGVSRTINGTVTLSSPAGASGAVVNLSAAPGGVITLAPVNVNVPSGNTTGTFTVTGVAQGSATITATSSGFSAGTATVLVANLGAIILPNVSVAPGKSTPLGITLSTPAPANGVTIALKSSDTSKLTVTPSVFIAQGATSPATTPQVTGIDFGSATLTASAVGYASATETVNVGAALSFAPATITIGAGGTQNVTLNLSSASPSGLSITLNSSNTAIVTVPATVNIGANLTSVVVPVTGVAGGTANITATASAANVSPASATVVVTTFGSIGLPSNVSIGLGQTASFPVVLSTVAPQSGVTVTLSSSDASKVSISPNVVTIAAGQTQPATQPQITGTGPGSATINASAPGFGSASKSVQTTASLSLAPPALSLTATQSGNLKLTLSGPAPTGGLVVNLSASPTGIITLPASVTIAANATTANIAVTGTATGTTTVTAASSLPSVSSATASVTVQSAGAIILPSNVTIGLGQAAAFQVTLPSAAPAAGVTVTLSSSDSTKVSISPLTVTIPAGATQPVTAPQVTGKDLGTANITASAPLYTSGTQPVHVTATIAFSPQTLTLSGTATKNLTLTLSGPAPAAGITFSVSSSNTAAATVSAATFKIPANSTTVNIPVSSVAPGLAVIRASAPNLTDATANVTVTSGVDIIIPATLTIAPGAIAPFPVTLAQPARTSVFISFASSDPTKATVSPSGVTIDQGQTQPSRQPNISGLASGQTTITASAPGLTSATSLVTVGVSARLTPATLTISGVNNDGTLSIALSAPAPSPITFTLSSSNSKIATVPSSILISQGTQTVGFKVTAAAIGTTVIKASAAGFPDMTSNVTVQSAGSLAMSVSSTSVQLQKSATVTLTLSAPAPFGGVSVTLNSNSTNLSVSPTLVSIAQGQTTGTAQITGLDVGSATISASAPGYASPAPIVIQIGATITWLTPTFTINGIGQQVLLGIKLSATVPQGLNGIPINLVSTHPEVATVPPNVTFYWDGSNAPIVRVPVTSVGPGVTVIHAGGVNIPTVDATITVVGPLTLSTTSLPSGAAGSPYSAPLSAAGGLTPYTFSATGLPANLSINAATGLISGTPTAAGTSTVNVTVTDSSTPTAQTVKASFTLLIKKAVPASVTVAGGSPQTANVKTAFASPLKALVKDAGGTPLSGVVVTFTAPATLASGTFAGGVNTATTDASGIATSAVFTANSTAGTYSVTAAVSGVATPATFTLTNATGLPIITATGGTPQSAKITKAFAPLIATVKDASGNPISGVVVTFAAPASGPSGTFAGGVHTATTNAQGVATSGIFTANTKIGAYVVSATVPGAAAAATFSLTNLTGDATSIAATSGTPQSAKINTAFGAPLVVTVSDAGSNPVGGAVVTFTVPASGASGTFAGGVHTATTNAQGVATSAIFTANGSLGSYSVTATTTGVAGSAIFALTNTQSLLSIAATSGTPQSAKISTAFAAPLVATVKNSAGTGVAGIVVTFAAPATGASGSFAGGVNTATTNAQGVATSALFTANTKLGTYNINATAPNTSNTAVFALTNLHGDATSITATSGTPQSAKVNSAFSAPFVATVTDAGGNPVNGVVVTFTAPAAGPSGTFAGGVNTATTNALGVATSAVFTANGTVGGPYTVSAKTAGVATAAVFTLNNTTLVLSITATSGTPQSAKINTAYAAPLVATVKDSSGNPVGGVVVTFTAPAAPASGTFAGGVNTAKTNAQGVATSAVFTANSKVGGYTVNATVTGAATPAAFNLTNLQGNPTLITATSGSGQSAKIQAAFGAPFVATVTDAGGNLVSGAVVTFHVPVSGASGTFAGGVTTATTNAQGVATSAVFTANTNVGTYAVTATVTGISGAATFSVTNLTGNANSIAATSGSGQSAIINAAFAAPLVATVRDAGGNPVSGAVVTFHVPASGASGSFAGGLSTATTNAQGVATSAVFTANGTVGGYSVTATTTGVATPATFALSNTQIPVGSIAIAGGSLQTAPVNTAFANPLKAIVKDLSNNPISGIVVTFIAPSSGASGTFAGNKNTAVSDASGVATSAVFTANTVVGAYSVQAKAGTVSTAFQLTNIAGPAAAIAVSGAAQQGTPINTAFPSPLQVVVSDAFNNPVSGATVTFTPVPANGASGTFAGGKNTATTASTGIATSAVFTANNKVGTYTVIASTTGTSGPVTTTFSMTNQPGLPAAITAAGPAQSTPINTAFPNPLKVLVTDIGGNGLRGQTVLFTPPASGASGAFAGGKNTAVTDSTGVATSALFTANGFKGSYTVAASVVGAPSVSPAQLSLTNAACQQNCGGTITAMNATIGKNLEAVITITLSPPAPASGVTLTITPSDPTLALVGSATGAGKTSISATLLSGISSVATDVQALAGSGTTTINISAPGYASATSTITFAPSGFVIAGPNGIGSGFNAFQGSSTPITVFAGRLDSAGNFVESQPVRGGFPVNVPVGTSDATIGAVNPATASFSGGDGSKATSFNASASNTGAVTVTATAPVGFVTPASGTTLAINVQKTGLFGFNATVGQGLEQDVTVSLGAPAPSGVDVTITSSDPTKLKFAKHATDVGTASITETIPTNHASSPIFYAQALASSGSVSYTATTANFGQVTGTVQLARPGLAIQSPGGFGAASFIVPVAAGTATLDVFTGYLDSGGNFVQPQIVAGSGPVSVSVVSSNTSFGTISSSPISIAGGAEDATTLFKPVAQGLTTVTASAPGFASANVNATVTNPNGTLILTTSDAAVGQNLESLYTVTLSSPAGTGGMPVTIQSSSPSVLLAAAVNGTGATSIVLTVPANSKSKSFYVQGHGNAGTATVTASASGFGSTNQTVQLSPAAIVLFPSSVSGSVGGSATVSLQTVLLDSNNTPLGTDEGPAGPTAVSIALASDHTSIATVAATVTLQPGVQLLNVPITLKAAGIASISLTEPAGFTVPNSLTSTTVSVQ